MASAEKERGEHVAGRPVHTFESVGSEQLTPHMVRILLGGGGFDTFVPSEFTDSYVKLLFLADDVDVTGLPAPLTLDSFAELPAERRPVIHLERGVAAKWASISGYWRRGRTEETFRQWKKELAASEASEASEAAQPTEAAAAAD